uniref:TNFR-Cys domain-containing protein n=1 Tax=Magallana gigas TaxID=29159 RepID=A0A8W8MRR1_MAGGI
MLKFICAIPVIVLLCFMKFNVLGCDGFQKCCVGYMWDEFLQNCTKCSTGYTGINCTEQCPFPTYGEICQKLCNCDSTLCDFSTGCKPNRTRAANVTMTSSMTEYDSRNPSENAEYTDTKSVYTEMTAVSLSNRGESLQLQRQPCQSVDDHVYSATDTLRFESETDTKEFLNE